MRSTSIEHNSILDAGYTGISLGWGWGNYVLPSVERRLGYRRGSSAGVRTSDLDTAPVARTRCSPQVTGEQTFMQDNHVVGNRIVGVMSALNDGGCVLFRRADTPQTGRRHGRG